VKPHEVSTVALQCESLCPNAEVIVITARLQFICLMVSVYLYLCERSNWKTSQCRLQFLRLEVPIR